MATAATVATVEATADVRQQADGAVRKATKSKKLVAGALSGMLSALAFQPLDVLRTHQQGAFGGTQITMERAAAAVTRPRPLAERVRSMWRGTTPTLVRVAGGAGLYFATLEHCLALGPNTAINTFLSGAFARTFAGCVVSPFTIVKARMEWQPSGAPTTVREVLRLVFREEGIRGFYRGIVPTMIRDVPFSGLYVLIYKTTKAEMELHAQTLPSYVANFSSGVFAGVVATTVVHPADVVKTRMQLSIVGTGENGELKSVTNSLNLRQTVQKIWVGEGFRGFTKGILPRVLKRTLSTALTWTIYEQLSVR